MQHLTIKTIQAELDWQDPESNKRHFEKLMREAGEADLFVLPEMFLTGFSMEPETIAEPQDGGKVKWLIELAKEVGAAICGSLVIDAGEEYRNRLLFVTPDGRMCRYDKRHLFRMGSEHEHYAAGEERTVIHYRGWRILPTICYDLRFPVWCRNRNDYDLMLCVANWPAPRRHNWRVLLQARAVENQAYVVGVNRVGQDGKGLEYAGDSMVVSHRGEIMVDSEPGESYIGKATLDLESLQTFRENFPAWADADDFTLAATNSRIVQL